ncbi:acetyl-CoA carboxylase biotin carboxylase subunit [Caldalkalibacillus salinus]|uniref:acetyl-CoA carboxylase biotin carboxylase subunit n=1 Tax=Caldalkalibacillus salinus TaxID=2803787 RepID=UPI001920ACCD|nr:acetyl-CoA carboxylase biotin carboxylase subunit [Caldalkalibacillus salinus]
MSKEKVLIANRGEIARRIIKTCHDKGYDTIAIYSDADQDWPYVQEATEAVHIGPSPVLQSYLQMDRIIDVAKEQGATYVHPGYGLLSENDQFARKCLAKGLTFIGPHPDTIQIMGDKIKARKKMQEAGVPVVPGVEGEAPTLEDALNQAAQLGYPVMLKASAGGGGIGMQICQDEEELKKAYESAKGRAKAYFGNDKMFIEKYIINPRHIEVQILGDTHGRIVHLFERDCSVQRRHQKVIEESPSPFLDESTREAICTAALKAAKAVDYVGAGTVEFVMGEDKQFYFLEMNTRLQVEHPVTEELTGLDIVALQLQVAAGEALPFKQEDVRRQGHVMEFRLYAEDPETFYPAPGKVERYEPAVGCGVRYDSGIESGCVISHYYDPMIAKLIVSGSNRLEVLEKSKYALEHTTLSGIKHNIPFLHAVLKDEAFKKGQYTTLFVNELQKKTSSQKQ